MGKDGFSTALHDLLPAIKARREEIEKGRRMPADLVEAMAETGLFRIGLPKSLGGDEAPPADQLRATETVATADGSAGWIACIGIMESVSAGLMPEAGAKEVHGDDRRSAGAVAPSGAAIEVDGGVRVSGRWEFASGITAAEWVMGGALVMRDGAPVMTEHGPQIVHFYVPIAEAEVHDTWFVHGLCGTGSNDFSLDDVFVPSHRIFNVFIPSPHNPAPLYQFSGANLFSAHMGAVALGIGRAALDEVAELAHVKVPAMSMVPLAQKPAMHLELARAEGEIGAARAFLYDAIDDMWESVAQGKQPTPRQRALARIAVAKAADAAANATRSALRLGGAHELFTSSSLHRHARDADAIRQHFLVSPHVWEAAGRVLLGLDPGTPVF